MSALHSDQLSKRARLFVADDHAYALAFAEWFGLERKPSRVLVSLYRATGSHLTVKQIGDDHDMTSGAVWRSVLKLREALETEAIDFQKALGYRLTDDGLAECRAALWQMGEVLRCAS